MKPTITIDLQEYNELLEARRNLYHGVKIITVDITVTEDYSYNSYGFVYKPDTRIIVSHAIKTNDEATLAVSGQLKETQKELDEVHKVYDDSVKKIKAEQYEKSADLVRFHNNKIEEIKKMSIFQFLRFKKER